MTDTTNVTWDDGMAFNVEVEGHSIAIDAAPHFGGQGRGPKPKTLLLVGLAGCTGMDVVSILFAGRWDHAKYIKNLEASIGCFRRAKQDG